jgi:hypothetical protein
MKLTKIQELLCLVLSSDSEENKKFKFIELYNQVNKKSLYKEAEQDELFTHLSYLIIFYNLDKNPIFQKALDDISKKMSVFLNELNNISDVFYRNNKPIIALKNSGILLGIYKNIYCSPMGDLDLLINKSDFFIAHNLMTKVLGYVFKFRSKLEKEDLQLAYEHGGAEYYKIINDITVWVEIQWRPVAGRWIQPQNEPDGSELIKNSIILQNSRAKILDPTDNLLQVCLHTAKHSYCRAPGFRLHSDVDRIVNYTNINWDLFLNKVFKLKIKTAVYYSLFFSKILLGTNIPDNILLKFKPGYIKDKIILTLIYKAGIFNQKKTKFTKFSYIIFNILLFDSFTDLFLAIFPAYNNTNNSKLQKAIFYSNRIFNLISKRENI